MRTCSKCKISKPLTEFYKIGNGINGVRPRCKECSAEVEREKYGSDYEFREKKLSSQRIKLRTDPAYRASHMRSQRKWHLKTNYGMTIEDFDSMLASQNGGCAICGTKPIEGIPKTRMVIDHCHKTKAIRGILCDLCNTALGKFKDDVGLLNKAIDYLTRKT